MLEPDMYADLIAGSINLLDPRLGAAGLSASDEFFAPLARMLNPAAPEGRAGVYDENGKWMDGWETRRRRGPGHDHCIVRLAAPCTLALLDIDTRFFTGNYPPYAAVEACRVSTAPDASTAWSEILPYSPLRGDQSNPFALAGNEVWTHLRLNIYPDGGVARFRAYGTIRRDWTATGDSLDLAAALNGGRALACSDEHYGSMHNLLLPGRGASMADGWETRRRREPGYDWVLLRLGHPGRVEQLEIDTAHFKGNFPHQISVHAALLDDGADADLTSQCLYWPVLLEPQLLKADDVVRFAAPLCDLGPVSHLRVNIHPDGGVSRIRVLGRPETRAPT